MPNKMDLLLSALRNSPVSSSLRVGTKVKDGIDCVTYCIFESDSQVYAVGYINYNKGNHNFSNIIRYYNCHMSGPITDYSFPIETITEYKFQEFFDMLDFNIKRELFFHFDVLNASD